MWREELRNLPDTVWRKKLNVYCEPALAGGTLRKIDFYKWWQLDIVRHIVLERPRSLRNIAGTLAVETVFSSVQENGMHAHIVRVLPRHYRWSVRRTDFVNEGILSYTYDRLLERVSGKKNRLLIQLEEGANAIRMLVTAVICLVPVHESSRLLIESQSRQGTER